LFHYGKMKGITIIDVVLLLITIINVVLRFLNIEGDHPLRVRRLTSSH
jgi:hypothetical protein